MKIEEEYYIDPPQAYADWWLSKAGHVVKHKKRGVMLSITGCCDLQI